MKPLFIILQEPSGSFGPRVRDRMYKAPNGELHVTASSHAKSRSPSQRIGSTVFVPNMPPSTLLLLDSLQNFKTVIDQCAAGEVGGKTCSVSVIPPGISGIVQPADVYIFRQYKAFVRGISCHVWCDGLDFSLFQRDNILKLQAFVHCQFRSPRFTPFIKYSWFKGGYTSDGPSHESPMDFCFASSVSLVPKCMSCTRFRLMRCSGCKTDLCFEHAIGSAEVHLCETFEP